VPERGMIIREPKDGSGLVAVNGKQYSFALDGLWHSDAAPEVGMPVDVTFSPDGAPESVRCADRTHPPVQAVPPKLS
jgi:hypothetical protein